MIESSTCPKISRIALVEDDSTQSIILKRQLERSGHCRITTFDSGDHFLLGGSLVPWDVILIDKLMPGLSGFDTIATLRNSFSQLTYTLSNTLVCILSAVQLDSNELQSAEALGVCFLRKTATTVAEIMDHLFRWRETASNNAARALGAVSSPVDIPESRATAHDTFRESLSPRPRQLLGGPSEQQLVHHQTAARVAQHRLLGARKVSWRNCLNQLSQARPVDRPTTSGAAVAITSEHTRRGIWDADSGVCVSCRHDCCCCRHVLTQGIARGLIAVPAANNQASTVKTTESDDFFVFDLNSSEFEDVLL